VEEVAMRPCCENEARKNVRRHRDVAVCDGCGRLVLGYTNSEEFEKTQSELESHGVAFEAAKVGNFLIVAKDRAAAPPEGELDDDEDEDDDDDDE
jgi:hypothetical protein